MSKEGATAVDAGVAMRGLLESPGSVGLKERSGNGPLGQNLRQLLTIWGGTATLRMVLVHGTVPRPGR